MIYSSFYIQTDDLGKHQKKLLEGFTLIELLIVIAILATLAVAVFVALNPAKRLMDSRNVRRLNDIHSLQTALHTYTIDNGGSLPPGLATNMAETQLGTCAAGVASAINTGGCNIPVGKACVDVSVPLNKYLKSIPIDPKYGSSPQTYYSVSVDANNIISVNACGMETAAIIPTATPTSSPITPTPTPIPTGNTYYVATSGSDTNPGTLALPFKTITKGVSVLTAGDTVLVQPGTYAESFSTNIPSGTSWASPVTIKALDPNNKPIIMPATGASRIFSFGTVSGVGQQYIIIDGFILDGTNLANDIVKITYTGTDATKAANHIRFINSEIRNSPAQGVLITGSSAQYNEFINDYVHNNGNDTQLEHGFYISTANNLVDNCTVTANAAYGIQLYNSSDSTAVHDNVIKNSTIFNEANKAGIVMSSGNANIAYNNIIWGNGAGGIKVDYGAANTKIFNNTIYSNTGAGITVGSAATTTLIENDIFYKNTSDISNTGTGTATSNNIINNVNPLFTNESTHDFHLQSGSPAIDTGLTLPEVPNDKDGITRPQGAGYDIGAYE